MNLANPSGMGDNRALSDVPTIYECYKCAVTHSSKPFPSPNLRFLPFSLLEFDAADILHRHIGLQCLRERLPNVCLLTCILLYGKPAQT